jgi:hypothetical protein
MKTASVDLTEKELSWFNNALNDLDAKEYPNLAMKLVDAKRPIDIERLVEAMRLAHEWAIKEGRDHAVYACSGMFLVSTTGLRTYHNAVQIYMMRSDKSMNPDGLYSDDDYKTWVAECLEAMSEECK